MSATDHAQPTPGGPPGPTGEDVERRPAAPALVSDISVTVIWFAVAAVLGALLWWQVTPLAEYTRTATNGEMGEQDLAKQVAADGWYLVIAAAGGLLSGVGLVWWRRRDPVAMVVLVALGGALATWLMLLLGQVLGPPDPGRALRTATVGAKVPVQLEIAAHGLWVTWSAAALLGAVGVIWGTERHPRHPDPVVAADD